MVARIYIDRNNILKIKIEFATRIRYTSSQGFSFAALPPITIPPSIMKTKKEEKEQNVADDEDHTRNNIKTAEKKQNSS